MKRAPAGHRSNTAKIEKKIRNGTVASFPNVVLLIPTVTELSIKVRHGCQRERDGGEREREGGEQER